jgi:hypothetical protein
VWSSPIQPESKSAELNSANLTSQDKNKKYQGGGWANFSGNKIIFLLQDM